MSAFFTKLYLAEIAGIGIIGIIYGIAALLGWKYARPKRWWDWAPAKSYLRAAGPFIIVTGILLLAALRYPTLADRDFNLDLLLILGLAEILSLLFALIASQGFHAQAEEAGKAYTPKKWVLTVDIAFCVLFFGSKFLRNIPWLRMSMLQGAFLLFAISLLVNYFAPAKTKQ